MQGAPREAGGVSRRQLRASLNDALRAIRTGADAKTGRPSAQALIGSGQRRVDSTPLQRSHSAGIRPPLTPTPTPPLRVAARRAPFVVPGSGGASAGPPHIQSWLRETRSPSPLHSPQRVPNPTSTTRGLPGPSTISTSAHTSAQRSPDPSPLRIPKRLVENVAISNDADALDALVGVRPSAVAFKRAPLTAAARGVAGPVEAMVTAAVPVRSAPQTRPQTKRKADTTSGTRVPSLSGRVPVVPDQEHRDDCGAPLLYWEPTSADDSPLTSESEGGPVQAERGVQARHHKAGTVVELPRATPVAVAAMDDALAAPSESSASSESSVDSVDSVDSAALGALIGSLEADIAEIRAETSLFAAFTDAAWGEAKALQAAAEAATPSHAHTVAQYRASIAHAVSDARTTDALNASLATIIQRAPLHQRSAPTSSLLSAL